MKKILLVGANGYIGSLLHESLNKVFGPKSVIAVDAGYRNNHNFYNPSVRNIDYRHLSYSELADFDDCVWVGGHSSVSQSINDPVGCFSNNLTGLVEFAKLFPGRLIYASSGSVYNNNPDQNCMETVTIGSPKNIYDYTKSSFDQYMSILGSNYIGLRFGTVVGGSPNMRSELLLNKMVKDALVNKVINLANPKAVRPVLYIEDLVKCLIILLNSHQTNEIFNLCSLNGDMEYYAESVSRKFMVPINHMQDSITYSFSMSNNKFSERFDFKFEKDINMILSNIQNNIIL